MHDPVAHCDFHWMEPWVVALPQFSQPTATVTCLPLAKRFTTQNILRDAVVTTKTRQRDPFSETLSEPLGSREMQWLQSQGVRRIKVLLDRNSAQATSVSTDLWYSPNLDELMSMTWNTPLAEGEIVQSFRLTEIKQCDPDPALFYPPKKYRIDSANSRQR